MPVRHTRISDSLVRQMTDFKIKKAEMAIDFEEIVERLKLDNPHMSQTDIGYTLERLLEMSQEELHAVARREINLDVRNWKASQYHESDRVEKLSYWLKNRGYKQNEFLYLLGLESQGNNYISQISSGKRRPSFDVLKRMLDLLDIKFENVDWGDAQPIFSQSLEKRKEVGTHAMQERYATSTVKKKEKVWFFWAVSPDFGLTAPW